MKVDAAALVCTSITQQGEQLEKLNLKKRICYPSDIIFGPT